MKKLTIAILGILLVGLVGAGILSITNADFSVPEKEVKTITEGKITFTIDGKEEGSCYVTSGDANYDDDFEQCLYENYAGKRITNVKDWKGNDYKQVTIDKVVYRSFDESKLQEEVDKFEAKQESLE